MLEAIKERILIMKTKNTTPKPKSAPLFVQFGIHTAILFVANGISSFFPASLPVPAPVIGLILLYLLLSCHIVKLEWVDSFGSFLISIIGFLFVPSGISLAASLTSWPRKAYNWSSSLRYQPSSC